MPSVSSVVRPKMTTGQLPIREYEAAGGIVVHEGQVLLLWLAGAALGWLGAWLAVSRHLGAIEPR